jgi:hypothetical protein
MRRLFEKSYKLVVKRSVSLHTDALDVLMFERVSAVEAMRLGDPGEPSV